MPLRLKKTVLLIGDLAIFFGSLFIVVSLRYPNQAYDEFITHFIPFSFILPFWLVILYISNLYENRLLKNNIEFFKTLTFSLIIFGTISALFFYFSPFFSISPKTNLFLFLITVFISETLWRQAFNYIAYYQYKSCVLLIGSSDASQKIHDFLQNNRQLGYVIKNWINNEELKHARDRVETILKENRIDLIIVPENYKRHLSKVSAIYKQLNLNLDVVDTSYFYEKIFQKVPISEIEETWFLDNLAKKRLVFDRLKWFFELSLSFFFFILLSPLLLFIFILLKIFSPGPAFFSQIRLGHNERPFTLYKFRTMKLDAESTGPRWAAKNDPRLTPLGRLLKSSHLDELPQLWNIVRGDISFVGPRPERPEFVKNLKTIIPYYETRHIVKPGITGWAQINYRYGSSIEDAFEKLQYDLFYIKHRSFFLDFSIIIKTLKTIFLSP